MGSKFIQKRGVQPRFSTDEINLSEVHIPHYWDRKEQNTSKSSPNRKQASEKVEICEGAFLDALRVETIWEVQRKGKLGVKVGNQSLGWLK